MPVGSTAGNQIEESTERLEALHVVTRVSRVANLYTIETCRDQWLEPLAPPGVPRMRPDCEAACFVRDRDCIEDRELVLGHERRACCAQVARERLAKIVNYPARDEGTRNMRPPNRPSGRLLEYFVERYRYPELVELFNDPLSTGVSHGAELGQSLFEALESRHVQGEQVYFMIVEERAQLDRRDDPDPETLTGYPGCRHAAHGVVVGECDRVETAPRRCFYYLLRWKYSVRGGGVGVQIDERRPSRRIAHRL